MSRYTSERFQHSSNETTEEYSDDTEPETIKLYTYEDLERLMESDNQEIDESEEIIIDDSSELSSNQEVSKDQQIDEDQRSSQEEDQEEEEGGSSEDQEEEEITEEVGWEEDIKDQNVRVENKSFNRYHKGMIYSAFMLFAMTSFYVITNSKPMNNDMLTFLKW